ncbi:MAG: 4-alpha-glucanotransferase, partial [Leptospiraceae bacterium]|nr:4-alpha-glucanotransferase [Leptospiraceae bacterium]
MRTQHKTLLKRRAGVSFPLVSLLSRRSYGCGDFYSLQVLHQWAIDCGLSIIQILPLNDLGYGRSPYSSISAFAIDPIYISLHLLGINEYDSEIPSVSLDHRFIKSKKIEILKKHFEKMYDLRLIQTIEEFSSKYSWIKPYVTFKILYEKNWGMHWSDWKYGSSYSKELEQNILNENRQLAHFHIWLQYVAFIQLKNIKERMESTGVYLLGDMPILTSDNSADVWHRTELFNRDLTSGAPPDYFNA